jgi:hypothetical protein
VQKKRQEALPPIAAFVGFSGVYDINDHYFYEARRSVQYPSVVSMQTFCIMQDQVMSVHP